MRTVRIMLTTLVLAGLAISVFAGDGNTTSEVSISVGWMSLIPAFIAIGMALITKEVISSLVFGSIVGAVIQSLATGKGFWNGLLLDFPVALRDALADPDHMSVILFSMFIGATVHLITRNGGMMALVKIFAARARDRRSGQLVTYFLGLAIFFDDYANTMVVGNTMRPVTDRLRISREKLAYIVDSTAAPIAAIAFITTWIGAELGYIQDGLKSIEGSPELLGSAYGIFLESLMYSFYPILTLIFMFFLIWRKRDFGPMLTAEREARVVIGEGNDFAPAEYDEVPSEKEYLSNALIPIITIVLGTIAGLVFTGSQEVQWQQEQGFLGNLANIIGSSDPYRSLVWASTAGLVVGILLTNVRGIFGLKQSIEHAVDGMKFMLTAIAILALAWTLAGITENLGTATFLAEQLARGFPVELLPAIVFLAAGFISFATGTSWGTMAILYPLVLLSSWELSMQQGLDVQAAGAIFANVVACVLAGSVLGDHCSPISDTTILSSLSSNCDHVSHVRTQLPYALTVGGVSVFMGILPASFGVPLWICFPAAVLSLLGIVSYFGKMD
ncbi:MAG: Na+/H+ antiporter NhaC family protein [Flavobacteriales bacterium]|nr:Na+/H+ antiporter NhaC family protein [Flavobacteriales bacterium]